MNGLIAFLVTTIALQTAANLWLWAEVRRSYKRVRAVSGENEQLKERLGAANAKAVTAAPVLRAPHHGRRRH